MLIVVLDEEIVSVPKIVTICAGRGRHRATLRMKRLNIYCTAAAMAAAIAASAAAFAASWVWIVALGT